MNCSYQIWLTQKRHFFRSVIYFKKSHYEVLGLTPKATQADIKSAYYKLSMVYHPDRVKNPTSQDTDKFREITEAYEVLGNYKSRRLYDLGGIRRGNYGEGASPGVYATAMRSQRVRTATPTGKTPIYDFDEWTRTHYGDMLNRDLEGKARNYRKETNKKDHRSGAVNESFAFAVLGGCIVLFIIAFSLEPMIRDSTTSRKSSDR